MAFRPRTILPVLIAEDGERLEFLTLGELLRYLETNLEAWDVSTRGTTKRGSTCERN